MSGSNNRLTPEGPPDWLLYLAYQRAARVRGGDRDAALFLLTLLKQCILEEDGMALTPLAREILSGMLIAMLEGEDPAKAVFLDRKPGNPKWHDVERNARIVVAMQRRILEGRTAWAAARKLADTKKFSNTRTGDPLAAKTINNIWLQCKDDPDYFSVFKAFFPST